MQISVLLPIKRTIISSSHHHYHHHMSSEKTLFSSLKLCNPQKKIGNRPNIFECFSPISSKSRLAAASDSTTKAEIDDEKSVIQLPGDQRPELLPKHVALIIDGHGRWAKNKGLPIEHAHYESKQKLKQLILKCRKFGIKILTVYVFSTEESPKGMHFLLALNYGGRYEITEASKKIACKVEQGILRAKDINESVFAQQLLTNVTELPNPDLLIRTDGELRVSNFLLWQMAYAEFYFSSKLFADFEEADLS
ncbi:hypothetical protein BUALT_Bualt13G0060200 [Buddleja alternifolia]|uniref:Alkyl transferase n=1 Tax=Buddleja alternifolia TaxID=168488 RepID=A0AAV6WQK3_9LAMI|nr:hypothetical protein BUALT_Bualt13G0060200 [Buddleja alternifolia]